MSSTLYLINDDQPGAFKRRLATIVRKIRVGPHEAVLVTIQPPIRTVSNARGHPLDAAIFVPRRRNVSIDDVLLDELQRSTSVFVCEPKVDLTEEQAELSADDVTILFWGLISISPESLKFPAWGTELKK